MGKSSSPPPIDYNAAAKTQGTENRDTAIAQANLNNPNMVTPYGTSTYSGPTDGTGRGTITQTLSPEEAAKLAKTQGIQNSSLDILQGDLPNIASALSKPFGLSGAPVSGYDPNFAIGKTQTQLPLDQAGKIQSSLDFSGSPGLVGVDNQTRKTIADAQYKLGAQYLDPQYAQSDADLTSKLANQGITPGSAAYDRAMLNQSLQKQKAYSDLTQNSVLAGNNAMTQEAQQALANRSQISSETQGAGQFANAAQNQGLNELIAAMQGNNAGVAQQADIASTSTQLQNQARQQAYSEQAQNQAMPINLLNALLSSSQVNVPQFQGTQPTSITPAPYFQGAQNQGQAGAAAASAANAQSGQTMGMIGSIAGAAAIAF